MFEFLQVTLSQQAFEALPVHKLLAQVALVKLSRQLILFGLTRALTTLFPRSRRRLKSDTTFQIVLESRRGPWKGSFFPFLGDDVLYFTLLAVGHRLGLVPSLNGSNGRALSPLHLGVVVAGFTTSALFKPFALPSVPLLSPGTLDAYVASSWNAIFAARLIRSFYTIQEPLREYALARQKKFFEEASAIKYRALFSLAGNTASAVSFFLVSKVCTRFGAPLSKAPLFSAMLATFIDVVFEMIAGDLVNRRRPFRTPPTAPEEGTREYDAVIEARYQQASSQMPGLTSDQAMTLLSTINMVVQSQRLPHRGRLYILKLAENLLGLVAGINAGLNHGLRTDSFQLVTEQFEYEEQAGGSRSVDHSKTCSICLDDYEDHSDVARLPCKHTFHKKCVQEWLTRNDGCPSCRQDVRQDEWYRDPATRRNAVSNETQFNNAVAFVQREINKAYTMRFHPSIEHVQWGAAANHYFLHESEYPARERFVNASVVGFIPYELDIFPFSLEDMVLLTVGYSTGWIEAFSA